MAYKPLLIIATTLGVLFAGASQAITMDEWAEKHGIRTDASYEATRVMQTKDGGFRFNERKAPGKTTMEMNMGGMEGTAIIRDDLKKAWFYMPDMGFYREMDMRQATQQQANRVQVSKVEEIGREEVNGFSTRKFKSRFKDNNGKSEGFMWITDEGIIIKMDMVYKSRGMKGQQMTMELENLQVRAQDPSYFELPAGLEPLSLGAMMRMATQMQENNRGIASSNPGAKPDAEKSQKPTLIDEIADTAADETKTGVKNETREAIRKGIRSLFKR